MIVFAIIGVLVLWDAIRQERELKKRRKKNVGSVQ